MATHLVDISASSTEEAAVKTEPREEAAAAGSLLPIGGGPVEESASERDRARAVGGDALARLEAKGDRARATAQGRKPERSRWIPYDSSECEAESSAAQHADQAPRSQPRDPSAVGDKKEKKENEINARKRNMVTIARRPLTSRWKRSHVKTTCETRQRI